MIKIMQIEQSESIMIFDWNKVEKLKKVNLMFLYIWIEINRKGI